MDPYEILGIKRDATLAEIKSAYRELSKVHHPDSPTGSDEIFMKLNLAYRVLSDKEKRTLYDENGTIIDEPVDHINSLVQTRLASLSDQWIDNMIRGNKTPLKEFIFNGLDNATNKIKEASREVERITIELNDIRKRLTHEDGKGMIHNIIDERIKNHKKAIIQNEQELIVIEKLKEAIEKYDFESDEPVVILFNTESTTTGFSGPTVFRF